MDTLCPRALVASFNRLDRFDEMADVAPGIVDGTFLGLADRIVVLKEGCVEQVGTPMELYKRPGNLFVAQFIGSPGMNILPAKIEKAGNPTVVSHVGGRKATVPIATPASAKGAAVSFGVRPEDLAIATGADYLFEGKVNYIERLGEVQLVYIDIGRTDLPLVAKLPGNFQVKRGEIPRLNAGGGDQHIFNQDGRFFLHWGRRQPTV